MGHTGGFGEPTCHTCHFDSPLNAPAVSTELLGIPTEYQPDSTYRLRIVVSRMDLGVAGFSMTSRFRNGEQAGVLASIDSLTEVRRNGDDVLFAGQTQAGSVPGRPDTMTWDVSWTAPSKRDTVVFHTAANAANGDRSEFGDLIRTLVRRTQARD